MPAELRVVERVPLLGSGKPDFQAAALLAAAGDETDTTMGDEEDAHAAAEV
jgi:hypothetical protein